MSISSRRLATGYRLHVDAIAHEAALTLATTAADAAIAPYELQQGRSRALIYRAAYRAASAAAYREVATAAFQMEPFSPPLDATTWSTTAVDAAVAAAARAYANAMMRQFARWSIGRWSLHASIRILPAGKRERYVLEFLGEISTLSGRRAQSRFAWSTFGGLPRLAWSLWFPRSGGS